MNSMRKATAVAVGGLTLLALGVADAAAEGSRTTYIAGWERGHESNRWYDNNSDSTTTTVGFGSCYTDSSFNSATVAVYQDVSWSPDKNIATRANYCNTTYYGRVSAGSYYFKVSDFSGGSRLSVDDVNIGW
ncbi:hypothetical protein OG389_29670 [Streptomyces sp. NBC_00435]|uniref:hypothetical protein n=1 Tax=Streptomyces sp. NBC_00435 TaxID=2903649 RepID=UPI002E1D4E8B